MTVVPRFTVCLSVNASTSYTYISHAHFSTPQNFTEAHLAMKEAIFVKECGPPQLLTHWSTFRQVGMESNGNAMSKGGEKGETGKHTMLKDISVLSK